MCPRPPTTEQALRPSARPWPRRSADGCRAARRAARSRQAFASSPAPEAVPRTPSPRLRRRRLRSLYGSIPVLRPMMCDTICASYTNKKIRPSAREEHRDVPPPKSAARQAWRRRGVGSSGGVGAAAHDRSRQRSQRRGGSPREAWAERPPYLAGREAATRRRKSPLPAAAFACEAKRPSTTASHCGLTPKVNHPLKRMEQLR